MRTPTKFEIAKIIEAIVYLVSRSPERKMSKLHLLKMLFFADRWHLRMYGRSVTGDTYYAMQYGPVPSECKNVAEGRPSRDMGKLLSEALDFPSANIIHAIRNERRDALSDSDVAALEAARGVEKKVRDLVAFSHNFPEWQKHESGIRNLHCRKRMDGLDFFLDAPKGSEYCEADATRVACAKEVFLEHQAAERALG